MKEHGVNKQHLAWISKLWEGSELFTSLVDTVLAALNKHGGKRERLRLRGMCGRHCGVGNITKSFATHDLGFHGRVQGKRPRDGPCKNELELNTLVTRPMAASGRRKSAMDCKLIYVGICMPVNESSAPWVQHSMKQAQETHRTRQPSALLSVPDPQPKDGSAGKSGLTKYDVGSTRVAPNKNWQDTLTTWRARMVADTARLRKAEETTCDNEQVRNGPEQRKNGTSTQMVQG